MTDAGRVAEANMQSRLSGTHNTKRGRLMQENLAEQTGDRKNLTIVKPAEADNNFNNKLEPTADRQSVQKTCRSR